MMQYIGTTPVKDRHNIIMSELFDQECDIRLCRLDLYPREDPKCYCVGFQTTVRRNGRHFYADTQVPLDLCQGLDSEQIAALGWERLHDQFMGFYVENKSKPPLLGTPFKPPAQAQAQINQEL
jgi:hypothetical protein